jgi:hypothetical protein
VVGDFSEFFCFFGLHRYSIRIFICALLLPGQTGEAWEPSTKQCSIGNRGALDRFFFSPGNVKDWMQTNGGRTRRRNLTVKVAPLGTAATCEAFS